MEDFYYIKQINRNSIVNIFIYESTLGQPLDIYAKLIRILNYEFPQILFTFGIVANLIQFILYNYKSNRSLNKAYFLAISLSQLIALFCTLANYVFLDTNNSLSAYSNLTCKIFNYLYRFMTDLSSWMAPMLILTTYFSLKSTDTLNSNRSKLNGILLVSVLLCIVNLLDIFYVELIPIRSSVRSNGTGSLFYICGIRDLRVLLIRDLVDLFFYFLLPFIFLYTNFNLILNEIQKYKVGGNIVLKRSKNYKIMIQRFKIIPFIFLMFNLPIFILTFLNFYLNLVKQEKFVKSFQMEFYFTLILLFNQSHYFLITLINMFYDKYICNKIKLFFSVEYRYTTRHKKTVSLITSK